MIKYKLVISSFGEPFKPISFPTSEGEEVSHLCVSYEEALHKANLLKKELLSPAKIGILDALTKKVKVVYLNETEISE